MWSRPSPPRPRAVSRRSPSTAWWTSGWSPGRSGWPSRCSSAAASCPANQHLRSLGSAAARSRRPCGVAGRCARARCVPGAVGHTTPGGAARCPGRGSGSCLPCRPTRLADHVRTEREVAAARARLGRRDPMTVGAGPRPLSQRPCPARPGPARLARRWQELAPGRALVRRRERHVVHRLVRSEDERLPGRAVGHGVHREAQPMRGPDRRGGTEAAPAVRRSADRRRGHFVITRQRAEVAQRGGVRNAAQDHGGAEE